ncbi:MAG: SH3 domain-containing protein [Mariprofundus sp.]
MMMGNRLPGYMGRVLTWLLLLLLPYTGYGAAGDRYEVVKPTTLRNGPHISHLQLAGLYTGDRVIELTRKGNWIRVRVVPGSSIGWVPELALKMTTASPEQYHDFAATHAEPLAKSSMPALTGVYRQLTQVRDVWAMQPTPKARGAAVSSEPVAVRHHTPVGAPSVMPVSAIRVSEPVSPDVIFSPESKPVPGAIVAEHKSVAQRAVEMMLFDQAASVAAQQRRDYEAQAKRVPIAPGKKSIAPAQQQRHRTMLASAATLLPVKRAIPLIQQGSQRSIQRTTAIRKGPGALYGVLGWAGKGADVVVEKQQGEWANVRMLQSGRGGWVKAVALQ